MNIFGKMLFGMSATLAWNIDVFANSGLSPENPFAPIATRNVFALNPPASADSTTPTVLLPTITPDGIMSVFGREQALFKVTDSQPAIEKSYILGEGQGEDDIEVIRIDEKNATVIFDNHGTIQEVPIGATVASGGFSTGSDNIGRRALSKSVRLNGNRFSDGTAGSLENQPQDNDNNVFNQAESGPGYVGIANGKTPSGQGAMIPNIGYADTASASDNSADQASGNSSEAISASNNLATQQSGFSEAERLADIRMVLFARQHMQ